MANEIRKCDDCKKPLTEENAVLECPYVRELFDEHEACYICKDCATERKNDV